ncbi:hypothetical protein [Actinoplanes sp. NPDC026623]|uniref:hypothetical protein n=1 Tax=Actinoplanes sp. NPDC026623 TaxID=3155610 RepID=UPI0033EB131F
MTLLVHNAPGPDRFGLPRAPGVYIITLDSGDKYVGQEKTSPSGGGNTLGRKALSPRLDSLARNIADIDYRLPRPGVDLNQLESETFDELGGKAKLPYNTNNPIMYKLYGTGPGGKCG